MQKLISVLLVIFSTLLIAGLYKPWWVLWWTARQNRKMVLLWYGLPIVVLAGLDAVF